MEHPSGFLQFVKITRAKIKYEKKAVRIVYISELMGESNGTRLAEYIADKAPLFYRKISDVYKSLGDGFFVSTMKETLAKLPSSDSFRSSHFGEIATAIFAEEVMGLRKLYSKLSLLTAENSNAYKMDLVLYNPNSDPVEFIFGEVKSSPKTKDDGFPVGHDKSCFADIFNSLNAYQSKDLQFDLTAAKDHINNLPDQEKERIRLALRPYSNPKIRYAGFAVIDSSTRHDDELSVLLTRKNLKYFDVDVICVENYPSVAHSVYKKLEALKIACSL